MEIEYSHQKNLSNIEKHGVSFMQAQQFDLENAVTRIDLRTHYGELRFNAIGYIGVRLYNLTFTSRGTLIRVISLRKANNREVKHYAKT